MHVRGFAEEGTTTTPFDMVVLNELDRYHLAIEAIERVPGLATKAAHVKQQLRDALIEHSRYIREHGEDMPHIRLGVAGGEVRPLHDGGQAVSFHFEFNMSTVTRCHRPPTGRREAPPMTNARQTISIPETVEFDREASGILDAPFAGHDWGDDVNQHSRGAFRPSDASFVSLERNEGRRECRMPNAPAALRAKWKKARTQVVTGTPNMPAFPAQWFTAYGALSPVYRLVSHRRIAVPLRLEHIGVRDTHFAVRAGITRQVMPPRPSHPFRFVTIAIRLCRRGTRRTIQLISSSEKAKYFSPEGLTRIRKISPTGKSVDDILGDQQCR